MNPTDRPTFWTTPVADGVRFRVEQLIFKTNDDAVDYVRRTMPSRLNEAMLAWEPDSDVPDNFAAEDYASRFDAKCR